MNVNERYKEREIINTSKYRGNYEEAWISYVTNHDGNNHRLA